MPEGAREILEDRAVVFRAGGSSHRRTEATVTIDAMGCQKNIAAAIVDAGGDYALALKDNHPVLRQEVETTFEYPGASGVHTSEMDTCRVETKGQV